VTYQFYQAIWCNNSMSQLITYQLALTSLWKRNQNFLNGNLGPQVISHCLLGFLNYEQIWSFHSPDNPSNFFPQDFMKEKLYVKPTPHEWNSETWSCKYMSHNFAVQIRNHHMWKHSWQNGGNNMFWTGINSYMLLYLLYDQQLISSFIHYFYED
jgi:hypothetical protein